MANLRNRSEESPPVLIVEDHYGGHRLVYVRIVAREALRRGHSVILALRPKAISSSEFEVNLAEIAPQVRLVEFQEPLRPRLLRRLSREYAAQVTIVPDGDKIAMSAAITGWGNGLGTLTTLVMRDPYWESPSARSRSVKIRIKSLLLRVAQSRPRMRVVWLTGPGPSRHRRRWIAVDPFVPDGSLREIQEGGDKLREELAMGTDVFWFVVTGAVTQRKNVPLILEALRMTSSLTPSRRLGLAIIGPITAESGLSAESLRKHCAAIGIEFRALNRLLTNLEMNFAVAAADSVVMAYSTTSPNSTTGKAAAIGTRLVAAGPASIQEFVRRVGYPLVSDLDARLLAQSLLNVIDVEEPGPRWGLASEHSFASVLLESTE